MNTRMTKKRGKKTARAIVAPLVLSLAFVAMTGLAPQHAAAQTAYPTAADTAVHPINGTAAAGFDYTGTNAYTVTSDPLGITVTAGNGGATATWTGGDVTVNLGNGAIIGPTNASTITGGNAGTAATTAGGAAEVHVLNTATFASDLALTGGNANATGGVGGNATLSDTNAASITRFVGDLTGDSGTAAAPFNGGAVNVNMAGTMRFVDVDANPATLPTATDHALDFTNTDNVAGGLVNVNIHTLEMLNTGVTMTLTDLVYADGAATDDNVDIGTLKLTNGGMFTTAATVRNSVSEYVLGDDPQQYTVGNVYVTGVDNVWDTVGNFTPATGNALIFDVTGLPAALAVDPTDSMLTMTTGQMDFSTYTTTNGIGDPRLRITGPKADQRGLIGRTFDLVEGTAIFTGGQWANNAVVRYYSQDGTSQFMYNTFEGLAANTQDGDLMAAGLGEVSVAKAYSQYQAAVAETAADVFLNNTWVANRDVADIAQPGTFGLTGRVSYFSINQDQDHKSEADKDQLAAAISGGWKFENGAGETTLGAFFEYGHGEYDTDTTVRGWSASQGSNMGLAQGFGSDKIKGDGDADLFGGGLFVYHDFMEGTYLDGGFRFGNVDQTYRIKGHGLDHRTKIDTDTSYWGLNFGVGHKFQLTDCANLDLYGKFLWTQFDGNSFNNGYGERIQMDTVDSIRTRVGARVTQGLGDGNLSVYYGAAWEQEWDGEATGKVAGRRIVEAADNSGASAFGELGLSYKPQGQNFAVEVGAFGLAGSQQGGGGTVGLKFDF